MAEIVEYLAADVLQMGEIAATEKKKITVDDGRGRHNKISPDKIVFRHSGSSVDAVRQSIESLRDEVDVAFLWEALQAESDNDSKEAGELASLFFDSDDDLHASAIFHALWAEKLHFRRRGQRFEPRSAEDVAQVREQRESEAAAAAEHELLVGLLKKREVDDELGQRLERFVRGQADRALESALESVARDAKRYAFDLLLRSERLPAWSDPEVIAANLVAEHPAAVVEHARARQLEPVEPLLTSDVTIDDPETREVDDALSITRDGALWRVDIDIADAAAFVQTDDPVDREARRRASTCYLPTGTFYMLPDVIGADRASLHVGRPRPMVRTSAWLDDEGALDRFEMRRVWSRVTKRLDYEEVDALMDGRARGDDELADKLCKLGELADKVRSRRLARGALAISRREWKIRVSEAGQRIDVKRIEVASAARELVAEMMILANSLGARMAIEGRVPIIFRVQPPPGEVLPDIDPDDPVGFARLKGLVPPASLSLHPGQHFGLGLDAYTQITSPLRRYGDLVQQRQLTAHLAGETPPYDAAGLLKVLGTVENTESELKRVEMAVTQRWALEYTARLEAPPNGLEALVIGEAHKGNRVQLSCCGAVATVVGRRKRELGDAVRVDVEEVKPRRGLLRLRIRD